MNSVPLMRLAAAVTAGYDVHLTGLEELDGGADPGARVFKGITDTGEQLFVKLRKHLDPGISLSAGLHNAGIDAVLAPVRTLSGGIAHNIDAGVVLVYPFKEGRNGFEQPLQQEHWRQIGASLRKIHNAELPQIITDQLKVEQFRVEGVDRFQATREQPRSSSPADEALSQFFRMHQEEIDAVMRRIVALGEECRSRDWELVPCHADLHVWNVLVEPNGFVNIIDWDSPRLAPRECDLMFFCGGGIMSGHGEEEEASFFQGYGSFEPNPLLLTYYRYARALEDFVAYASEATDPEVPTEQQMEAVRGLGVLFRPGEIVHIATASDRELQKRIDQRPP